MRILVVVLAIAATFSAAGCASRTGAAPAAPEMPLPRGATVTRDPLSGTVLFLKGKDLSRDLDLEPVFRATRNAGDAEGVARTFLSTYAPVFRLDAPGEELVLRRIDLDKNGSTHVRFEQSFRGMPIPGAQLIVHLDRNRRVVLVSGNYIQTPRDFSATPTLSAADARAAAEREGGLAAGACAACAADLVLFTEKNSPLRLAWRVGVPIDSVGALERTIDAEDGTLLRSRPVALSRKWREMQR